MLKKNRIGLVAGGGKLPLKVLEFCEENSIEVFVVLIKNFYNIEDYKNKNVNFIESNIGRVGKISNYFKKNNVKEIVMAGNVKKPSFSLMKMDFTGFRLLRRILKNKILGDNKVLEILIDFCTENGFEIANVNKYLYKEEAIEDFNGNVKFQDKEYQEDIKLGVDFLKHISEFDVGQAVIVQQKNIIGVECVEGTQKLIERCNNIKYETGRGAILVKIKKLNQTNKIDLPSIGVETIKQLKSAGIIGVAFDCENCIIIDKKKVIEEANNLGIFLYGVVVR